MPHSANKGSYYTKQHLKCHPELVSGSDNDKIPKHGGQSDVQNDSMSVF